MVLRKKLLEEVRAFIGTDVIKVFTGVRRCGKSVLMGQVRDLIVNEIDPGAPTFYLDLDDEENARYLKEGVLYADLERRLKQNKKRKTYFFLDEVHDVERWEKVV